MPSQTTAHVPHRGPEGTHSLVYVERIAEVRHEVATARSRGLTVGVVPTMGALHEGHLSLIDTARVECGCVVVTIFVNPAQFGPHEDFDSYPRTLDTDLAACRRAGADVVFHPSSETVYPPGFQTSVQVAGISDLLEGAFRPGHFGGVATVVLKLFNIVQPDVAYFGQKDYQQQVLIRRMCRDLDLPIDLHVCPTVREADGLAMSSRNRALGPRERQAAPALFQSLVLAKDLLATGTTDLDGVRSAMREHLIAAGVRVDYAAVADPETLQELSEPQEQMVALVAGRIGATRLIDNLPIELPVSEAL